MDWMEFVSALVRSLAWPSAIVIAAFVLKKPIVGLLGSEALKRVSLVSNLISVEFDRSVASADEQLAEATVEKASDSSELLVPEIAAGEAHEADGDTVAAPSGSSPRQLEQRRRPTEVPKDDGTPGAGPRRDSRERAQRKPPLLDETEQRLFERWTRRAFLDSDQDFREALKRMPPRTAARWAALHAHAGRSPRQAVIQASRMLSSDLVEALELPAAFGDDLSLDALGEYGMHKRLLAVHEARALDRLEESRRLALTAPEDAIDAKSAQDFVNVAARLMVSLSLEQPRPDISSPPPTP